MNIWPVKISPIQPLHQRDPGNSASGTGPIPDRKIDGTFRRIVVVSTAIGFATVLGLEACLERGVGRGYDFHWHWRAVFWAALGIGAAVQLWRLFWRLEANNTARARGQLIRFCVCIMAGALCVFLYPILFVTGEQLHEVIFGLCLAVIALTFVGWMICRVVRGFLVSDDESECRDSDGATK